MRRMPAEPLTIPRRVHLLGIGGAGVSGVARILHARGHRVSGHDRAPSPLVDALRPLELSISIGESLAAGLPGDAQLLVRSAAVGDDDPQVQAARAIDVPVVKYAEVLQALAPPERTLAVTGTHGKTTTSWMLYHALAGIHGDGLAGAREPGALIGGLDRSLGVNAVPGATWATDATATDRGGWFVFEACEYDRTFLRLSPFGAAITNVEADHLDYYGSFDHVVEAFGDFAERVHPDGLLVLGEDVPAAVEARARCRTWRLGRELEEVLYGERQGSFRVGVLGCDVDTPAAALGVPGRFNASNACAALALAVGVSARGLEAPERETLAAAAAAGIELYRGAGRRFEPWGSVGGVDVVHDYAHHPTEVRVTLEMARRVFPGRPLHVLFQPHQHSRTARFLVEFAESLRSADRAVVADVYGARKHTDGVRHAGAPELVTELRRRNVIASEGGHVDDCVDVFLEDLPPGAAALVLGAGDIEGVRDELLGKLAVRRPPRRESLR